MMLCLEEPSLRLIHVEEDEGGFFFDLAVDPDEIDEILMKVFRQSNFSCFGQIPRRDA